MYGQFDFCFQQTLGHEGAFGADPKDKGNWTGGKVGVGQLKGTKYGISAASYPDVDIKNLTVEQAKKIYKRDFWDRMKCDSMPAGVDFSLWDFGVNSGTSRAVKTLQAALDIGVDGLVGNQTKAHAQAADPAQLVNELNDLRLEFLKDVSTWSLYGKGWSNRIASVRKVSLQMVKNEMGKPIEGPVAEPEPVPQPSDVVESTIIIKLRDGVVAAVMQE